MKWLSAGVFSKFIWCPTNMNFSFPVFGQCEGFNRIYNSYLGNYFTRWFLICCSLLKQHAPFWPTFWTLHMENRELHHTYNDIMLRLKSSWLRTQKSHNYLPSIVMWAPRACSYLPTLSAFSICTSVYKICLNQQILKQDLWLAIQSAKTTGSAWYEC